MGGNTARLSAERKPHEYQGINYAARGMRVSCPSCWIAGAARTLAKPWLGSWSQGRAGWAISEYLGQYHLLGLFLRAEQGRIPALVSRGWLSGDFKGLST